MRRRLAVALALLALVLATAPAHAGMVFGPYLIWVNLAGDASADEALHDYTHAEPTVDTCWNGDALLLIGDYPAAITPELVRRAVVTREPAAQSRLRALLRKGNDDFREGYDGVIVVPKGRKPMLLSFGADGRARSHSAVGKTGQVDWTDAFCEVQPPVLRKP
jgi:hypothetical protein